MFKFQYFLLFVTIHCIYGQHQQQNAQQINQNFYDDIQKLVSLKLHNKEENELLSRPATTDLDKPPRPKEIPNWPSSSLRVGQITAVAINPDGNPVIFHRGDRIWKEE